jgi:transcription elongation factor GreB
MSKAFVRESDEEADTPEQSHALPVGLKNYMTPHGYRQLQEELRTLLRVERPKVVDVVSWAAGNGDRSENGDYIYGKRRLREIDRRIRFLSKRLEIAQVVDPTQQKNLDQVFFGATVTYAHERGTERTITIVGVDEADLDRQQVSWISPIARALMNGENDYHRWCRRGRSRSSASELDIAYCASPDEGARGRHCRASDPCWD